MMKFVDRLANLLWALLNAIPRDEHETVSIVIAFLIGLLTGGWLIYAVT